MFVDLTSRFLSISLFFSRSMSNRLVFTNSRRHCCGLFSSLILNYGATFQFAFDSLSFIRCRRSFSNSIYVTLSNNTPSTHDDWSTIPMHDEPFFVDIYHWCIKRIAFLLLLVVYFRCLFFLFFVSYSVKRYSANKTDRRKTKEKWKKLNEFFPHFHQTILTSKRKTNKSIDPFIERRC